MMFFEFATVAVVVCSGAFVVVKLAQLVVDWRVRSRAPADLGGLEERLARLEHAVEAATAENQRLADGHRFFMQLLATKPAGSISAPPAAPVNGATAGASLGQPR
jgi:hypothetical protein